MTPKTRLLGQRSGLFRRAVADAGDINAAYLIGHTVMSDALECVTRAEANLSPALLRALDARSLRQMAMLEPSVNP